MPEAFYGISRYNRQERVDDISRTGNDRKSGGNGSVRRIIIACVFASLCVAVALPGASTAAPPAARSMGLMPGGPAVSGTVSFTKEALRDQTALPGMAMLHVELLDVSGKDLHTGTLGEETIWIANGKLPMSFRIAYDPTRIDPTRTYVVRARIMEDQNVLFLSTTPCYVLTRGAPTTVDIAVTPARVRIR